MHTAEVGVEQAAPLPMLPPTTAISFLNFFVAFSRVHLLALALKIADDRGSSQLGSGRQAAG